MKKRNQLLLSLTASLVLVTLGLLAWWFWPPSKPLIRSTDFRFLPGWISSTGLEKSLITFQNSCRVFMKQDPNQRVGTSKIPLQVKDWQPACRAALEIQPVKEKTAKLFFQEWFAPIAFYEGKPVRGLFTGYYMPLVKGSLSQSAEFKIPIYETPSDLVTANLALFIPRLNNHTLVGRIVGNKMLPYYTREQINQGAIKDTARVLLWINNPVDRLFLEIEGSGIIELEDGKKVYIGYDAQNGAPYTPIAKVLIQEGIMNKHNASMQAIKRYLKTHPKEVDKVINQNKSFIFFRSMPLNGALGSQGVALTPGYSMAIDKKWIPMGTPLWLSTTRPDNKDPDKHQPMHRLMIAQDTGGAIRGKVRGDVYWGAGKRATVIAGHMKNEGYYWLLLPRPVVSRLLQS